MPDERKVREQLCKIIDEKRIIPVYQPIVSFIAKALCLKDLYSQEDYERKEICSKNRKGETEIFPLASISGALLTNENVQILGIDDFSYKIALTKKASKKKTGDSLQKYDDIA